MKSRINNTTEEYYLKEIHKFLYDSNNFSKVKLAATTNDKTGQAKGPKILSSSEMTKIRAIYRVKGAATLAMRDGELVLTIDVPKADIYIGHGTIHNTIVEIYDELFYGSYMGAHMNSDAIVEKTYAITQSNENVVEIVFK